MLFEKLMIPIWLNIKLNVACPDFPLRIHEFMNIFYWSVYYFYPDIHILSFIRIVRGIKEIMRFRNKNSKRFKVFYGAFFVEVWKPLSSNFIANLNPLFEWNKNRRNKIRASKENEIKIVVFSHIDIDFLRFTTAYHKQFIYCKCMRYS